MDPAAVGDILEDALREGVRLLKHHADARAHLRDVDLGTVEVHAVEAQRAVDTHHVDQVIEPVEAAQQSRLPTAGRSDEGRDLLFRDLQRDAIEGERAAVPEREPLGGQHRLVDARYRHLRIIHDDLHACRLGREPRHRVPAQMLRVAYFSRKWFRTRIATRLLASTTAIRSKAVAKTRGLAASTFGLWKPTS